MQINEQLSSSKIVAKTENLTEVSLFRALQLVMVLIKNEKSKEFLVKSNIIAPIMNLLNTSNAKVMSDWFDILTDLCQTQEFLHQFIMMENLELLFFRALQNTMPESNESLMRFLSLVAKEDKIRYKLVTQQNVKNLVM